MNMPLNSDGTVMFNATLFALVRTNLKIKWKHKSKLWIKMSIAYNANPIKKDGLFTMDLFSSMHDNWITLHYVQDQPISF